LKNLRRATSRIFNLTRKGIENYELEANNRNKNIKRFVQRNNEFKKRLPT
jgi:hypothetical protein